MIIWGQNGQKQGFLFIQIWMSYLHNKNIFWTCKLDDKSTFYKKKQKKNSALIQWATWCSFWNLQAKSEQKYFPHQIFLRYYF